MGSKGVLFLEKQKRRGSERSASERSCPLHLRLLPESTSCPDEGAPALLHRRLDVFLHCEGGRHLQACTRNWSGSLRAATAPARGVLAPSQLASTRGRYRPMRDSHHPHQLAVSSRMLELAVAGAFAGAGSVYAASPDEGLKAFLIFPSAVVPPAAPYGGA